MKIHATAFLILFALVTAARAEVLVLTPTKDNTLFESGSGGLSNGQGTFLYAGKTNQALSRRALLAFDLTTLPADITITGVSLVLAVTEAAPGPSPVTMTLHSVSQNWGEGSSDAGNPGGSGAVAATGDATWLHTFSNTSFWTTPGGDFAATASASTAVGSGGTMAAWSGAGLIADVEAWIANPGSNFGWLLLGDESVSQTARRFNSRESLSDRPTLTITYVAVPEPATGALLVSSLAAVGAIGARRFRRSAGKIREPVARR